MLFPMVTGLFASELAIDLGTANTVVYARGRGIVSHEPSVMAVQERQDGSRVPLSFGRDAQAMVGKTPAHIAMMQPIRNGVVADSDLAWLMLKHLIKRALRWGKRPRLRVVLGIPPFSSTVEQRALVEPAEAAGANEVYLVYEPIAAALGAGLDIHEPYGRMIVDIGGGTTDIAIISLGELVYSKTLPLAGKTLDLAVRRMLRSKYQLDIGEPSAERLKIALGSVQPFIPPRSTTVKGIDSVTGMPRTCDVLSDDVRAALLDPLDRLVAAIQDAFEVLSPELVADIGTGGLTCMGGGALLHGLLPYLEAALGLPVHLAPHPMMCVALGAGYVLEQTALRQQVARRL